MNDILVSIIVPVYNKGPYLSACIDSIRNQTYKNIEIICINDGSTDNSLQIVENYKKIDPRIRIINQDNKGVSFSRNVGIEVSTGDYILFIDADDTIDKSCIEILVNIVNKNNDIDDVIFDHTNIYENTAYPINRITRFVKKHKNNIFNFYKNPEIIYITTSVWNQLLKKKFLLENNIRFSDKISHSEDLLFYTLILLSNPKIYLHSQNLYFCNRCVTNSAASKSEEGIDSSIMAIRLLEQKQKFIEQPLYIQKTIIASFLLSILNAWFSIKNIKKMNEYDSLLNQLLSKYNYPIIFTKFNCYKGAYLLRYRYTYSLIKNIVLKIIKSKIFKKNRF